MHTWSGLSGQGTSRAFLNTLLNRIADNRPGANKQAKLSEMTQALSCIVAAQIAEQISAAVGPWEIPVMPAWEVPLRTDEHGNSLPGVKKSVLDSYSELTRRTKPRRSSPPTQAPPPHPSEQRVHTSTPASVSQTTPSEYSPSFMIPSGPGGLQSAAPSPMDVLPRFPADGSNLSNGNEPLTGDTEADRLIRQLIQAGDWSPLTNDLALLPLGPPNPSTSEFTFDASSMLLDLMACLVDPYPPPLPSEALMDVEQEGQEPSPAPTHSTEASLEGGERMESLPSARTRSSKKKNQADR